VTGKDQGWNICRQRGNEDQRICHGTSLTRSIRSGLGIASSCSERWAAFSSFALAFSLISINTGIFANFRHGFQQVGPAVVWSWLVVLAPDSWWSRWLWLDLSARIPLSGYGYQWTARLDQSPFRILCRMAAAAPVHGRISGGLQPRWRRLILAGRTRFRARRPGGVLE
jgi:hypothetical protein